MEKPEMQVDFTQFYREWYEKTVGMAFHLLKDRAQSEDLVQDVFLKLLENPQTLGDVECISGYLHKCVRNRCINLRHRKASRKNYLQNLDFEEGINNVDQYITTREIIYGITNMLQCSSRRKRQILRLRVEGYNDREMSAILGLNRETVKRAMYDSKLDCIRKIGFLRQKVA